MIIRTKKKLKQKRKVLYIIFFIIYTMLVYITQYFYRKSLFDWSLYLTSKINGNDAVINYLPYYHAFALFLGSHKFYFILIIFVFNSANIFKSFIFITSMSIVLLLAGLLKMIYQTPLMYYSDYPQAEYGIISPIVCGATWGVPSAHAMSTVTVYLTLWKIVFDCSRLRYKKYVKGLSLALLIILIIFINVCSFLAALHSIDQILFGALIGFQIYFFIFYVLRVDLNDGKDLFKIVSFRFYYFLVISIIILCPIILIYFCVHIDKDLLQLFEDRINQSKCRGIGENLRFSNDALILCTVIFSNLGMIIGMKLEYKNDFKGNEMNWRQYNFNKENGDEDSLLSKLSISKESQWNHTSFFFSFLRLLSLTVFHAILLCPMYLISFDSPFYVVILFKTFTPLLLSLFCMFYFEKILLRKLGLTNDALFKLFYESL